MHSNIKRRTQMTPNDVKELLKTLIIEKGLPIEVVDIAPNQNFRSLDTVMESRIKDVIHQWNTDGNIHSRSPVRSDIMEFYTKSNVESAVIELLESIDVEALIKSIITEQNMAIRFTDQGFRLITLAEDDSTRYPVKILHGGFRLEKPSEVEVPSSQLKRVTDSLETTLREKHIKAKMFHRGFSLEKTQDGDMHLAQIKEIAKKIDDTLGINYVLNSYNYLHSDDEESETALKSASICISLWRFPRR